MKIARKLNNIVETVINKSRRYRSSLLRKVVDGIPFAAVAAVGKITSQAKNHCSRKRLSSIYVFLIEHCNSGIKCRKQGQIFVMC